MQTMVAAAEQTLWPERPDILCKKFLHTQTFVISCLGNSPENKVGKTAP